MVFKNGDVNGVQNSFFYIFNEELKWCSKMVCKNGVLKCWCEMVFKNGLFWPFVMKSWNDV